MKVGIIQSSFIPWRGYFDFISSVDLFIFHDDLQYTKGDWRNRNKIKTPQGAKWITVPVSYHTTSQLICETVIDDTVLWRQKHINQWRANYNKASYLYDVINLLGDMGKDKVRTISELNILLTKSICEYLGIHTRCMLSSELNIRGAKTQRLIDILRSVNGKTYLSGPSADNYLDKEAFRQAGIRLEYKTYEYKSYPQLWGEFENSITILDLIANCGPDASKYIHSSAPNQIIVP